MGVNNTTYRNLPWADSGTPMHETFEELAKLLEKGLLIYVAEWGEDVSEFDPICIIESDDFAYKADGNAKTKTCFIGIAYDDYSSGSDGFVYGPGCLVNKTGASWTRNNNIYVADDQSLSQTPGTYIVPVGVPITDTYFIVTGGNTWYQLSHIADPAACAAMTFSHSWDGSTYPTADEGNKVSTDLGALKTAIDANNTAIDSILARLEAAGISDDGT